MNTTPTHSPWKATAMDNGLYKRAWRCATCKVSIREHFDGRYESAGTYYGTLANAIRNAWQSHNQALKAAAELLKKYGNPPEPKCIEFTPGALVIDDNSPHETVVRVTGPGSEPGLFAGVDEHGNEDPGWIMSCFVPYDADEYADCWCPHCVARHVKR